MNEPSVVAMEMDQRRSESARGRRRCKADDGQDARQYQNHPPAAQRGDRRPRGRRADDQAFHQQGAGGRKPLLGQSGSRHLRPLGSHLGRAPRDSRRRFERRREQGLADRRADGCGNRCRACRCAIRSVDGRRHRRRNHRGRSHLAAGPGLSASRRASAATRWTRRSPPTSAATTICSSAKARPSG